MEKHKFFIMLTQANMIIKQNYRVNTLQASNDFWGKKKLKRENDPVSTGTSVSFMPGFILDTASAVGDMFVICSSVSTDVEPAGPVICNFS